ncbi:MAG: hypothetical protein CMK92_04985 [Pseudomonas sp.]|nr:hypothetical protein [Pseudomonas sp.]
MTSKIINIPSDGKHVQISGRSMHIRSFGKIATISSTGSEIRIFARFCATQDTFWIHIVESNKRAVVDISAPVCNLWVSVSYDVKSLTVKGSKFVIVTQNTGYARYGTFMHDKKFEAALDDEMAMKVTMIGTDSRMSVVGERARSLLVARNHSRIRRRRRRNGRSKPERLTNLKKNLNNAIVAILKEEKESIAAKSISEPISEPAAKTAVEPISEPAAKTAVEPISPQSTPIPETSEFEIPEVTTSQQDFAGYMAAFRNDRSTDSVGMIKSSYVSPIVFVPDLLCPWRPISA